MTRRSYTSPGHKKASNSLVVEFDLDGVTFRNEDAAASVLDFSEFARLATMGVDSKSAAGASIIAEIFMMLLGESTYQRFRAHCRRHGTDDETLLAIIGDLMEEAGNRPTGRPSDSSDGPPTAPATATVVSFSRGTVEQTELPAQQPKETPRLVSYG
ncbi:hypothetical protein [Streptosporangium sp. V21-05]|uniref:hypothetical protein n=1 Tax=Streptosporangium sp. V21-05 TaxID=3446115 RepID=UPI003F52977D